MSGFRFSGWQWVPKRGEFYYHMFAVQQPDLNYRNPRVVEAMKSVLRFWLDRGVAGYRVDAVPHLFEVLPDSTGRYPDEPLSGWTDDKDDYGYLTHPYTTNRDETFDMVYQWRELLDQYKKDHGGDTRVMMTEAYEDVPTTMRFYEDGQGRLGSHFPFNFQIILNLGRDSKAVDFKNVIDSWMTHMPQGRTANWVMGNHDQRRVASRFGIERIDLMNMVDLTLPGVAITYDGEEIGMTDVLISWEDTVDPQACNTNKEEYEVHSRDAARTPFQWDDSTSTGFSTNPKTWLPVSPDYRSVNVKQQEGDSSSHLNVYRQLMSLRKQPAFQYGTLATYSMQSDQLLVLVRRLDSSHDAYMVVANLGDKALTVDLSQVPMVVAQSMVYEVVDSRSKLRQGTRVDARYVYILPSESFVLRIPAGGGGSSGAADLRGSFSKFLALTLFVVSLYSKIMSH